MDVVFLILIVLHVACAATSFGVALPVGSAVRRATTLGRDVRASTAAMAVRANAMVNLFSVLTLATGLGLIFYRGGMKAVAPPIHAAMGLIIIMIVLGLVFMRPLAKRLSATADKSEGDWRSIAKRMAMGGGILQLLWLVTLTLMFVK